MPREHPARVDQQVPQQAVLGGGQVNELPGAANLVCVVVHLEVAEDEAIAVARSAGPPQDGVDTGDGSATLKGFVT